MGEQIVCSNCLSNADSSMPACPYCGQSFENTNPAGTLPVNTLLAGRYTIGRVLALDGEDSPYLTENCLLKDTDTPVAEQVQKLFVLDKNNMASPESAESE